jgi:hypothetical protein
MTNSKNTITTKSKSDLITTNQADTICEKTHERLNSYRNTRGKTLRFQLDEILSFLKKKSGNE